MREGPLSEYIDTYAAHLKLHNYSQAAGAQRIGIVAGLSRWMAKKNLVASNINESLLDQYCKYQKRTRTVAVNTHFYGALRRMLSLFRELGVSPHLLAAHDAREQLMQDFEKHLLDRRGLTRSSADTYVPIAREFTLECLPGKSLSWKKLSAGDVVRFIEGHEHARRVCSPLRSFLRYLHYTGAIKTDLASAVPAIARWKYAALPGSFQPAQIAQILRCCNRQSSLGKRDYAILLLLARLGLRANEIATLCLGDIDWHSGQLILKRTKTDELAKLPLPVEVGEAIADYL